MTACESKSIDSQLVGSWYIDEGETASFILYSDGTCEIAGEYGVGKWSVVNDNVLKLTNYYGQVETATIKSIGNGILVVGEGNDTNTFRSNPISEDEEVTQGNADNLILTDANKDVSNTMSDEVKIDEIALFAGPGEDYYVYGTVNKVDIKKVLKIEGEWAEVQLLNRRAYVRRDDIAELCTNEIPRVVYKLSFDQNVKLYPTVYCYNTEIVLYDDVKLYNDVKGNSVGEIDAGEKVKVLFKEKSGIVTYNQIEVTIDEKKYRYYANHMDLFSLDNPLVNFEKVKETSAVLSYEGEDYYSTSGENTQLPRDWKVKEEFSISKTEWDIWAGIVGVIASNDVNDEAMDAAAGLINVEEREFINSNVKSNTGSNMVSFIDFFFNGTLNFLKEAQKTTILQIQLKECGGEQKIVIKTGTPIEQKYAGKKMSLEELIVNHNNTAATMINSSKKANEIIKSIYPKYDKNKKYHMQMTFAKNTDGYGYYIVIDKDYKVYAVPIVHEGTSMAIYSDGQLVYDAAYDLASCMIQVDEESAQKILQLMEENGITIKGKNLQENQSSISSQSICDAMTEASIFAWNWFWDSSREIVDENDTYMQMTEDGLYNWEYKYVTYEGIHNVQDVLELTKHYFTEDVAKELVAQKQWYECGNKLYMSEPDGIGGYAPDYYDIVIRKDSDTQYTITVYEYFGEELMMEPYEIHYKYVEGYWVFDQVMCQLGLKVPINVISEDMLTSEESDMSRTEISFYGEWSNCDEVESMEERLEITFESDEMIGEVSATIAGREYATGTCFIQEDGTFSCTLIIDAIYNNANAQWEPAYDVVYINGKCSSVNSIECELQYEGAKTIRSYYLKRM